MRARRRRVNIDTSGGSRLKKIVEALPKPLKEFSSRTLSPPQQHKSTMYVPIARPMLRALKPDFFALFNCQNVDSLASIRPHVEECRAVCYTIFPSGVLEIFSHLSKHTSAERGICKVQSMLSFFSHTDSRYTLKRLYKS